jgi:hypothetical protein
VECKIYIFIIIIIIIIIITLIHKSRQSLTEPHCERIQIRT